MYTNKQLEVIKAFNTQQPRILISQGAKRSGKTHQNNDLWLTIVAKRINQNKKYIMIGNTLGTLKRNVIDEMERRFKFKVVFNDRNEFQFLGNTMCCFGGSTAAAYKTIQGFEAAGAYINEASLIHEQAFREVLARCSADDAQIICDSNPDHPNHYFKTDFIEKSGKRLNSGKLDILSFHFTIWDNAKSNSGYLSDDYVDSFVSNLPPGVWRKRDAEGLWVAANGVIYDMYNEDVHLVDRKDIPQCDRYDISVDYGTQNACTFGLYGYNHMMNKHYLVDEYYYDGRKTGKQKTDKEYSDDLQQFIKNNKVYPTTIIVDPSAASLKVQLRQDGLMTKDAKNDVQLGIRNVMHKLHSKQYQIAEHCKDTRREYGLYSWNDKLLNKDEPLKENDHTCDRDRYYFQTLYPLKNSVGLIQKNMGW